MTTTSAVIVSRQWDAHEAGKELGRKLSSKLRERPAFAVLLTSIHYADYGGFEKLLRGVYEYLPKGTPLVGGTVGGFLCPEGVYTRGAALLGVAGTQIDAIASVGRRTKANPHKAAQDCARPMRAFLDRSAHPNEFVYTLVSDGIVPKLPVIGQKRILFYPLNKWFVRFLNWAYNKLGYGVGREPEVLDELSAHFPDALILAGATYDNDRAERSFQFCYDKVYSNAVVALGIRSQFKIHENTTFGLTPTGTTFSAAGPEFYGCAFKSLDGGPASDILARKLHWDRSYLDETIYSKSNYYPLGYESSGRVYARAFALVLGPYVCFTYPSQQSGLRLYTTSGRKLLAAVTQNLQSFRAETGKAPFVLGIECAIRLGMLGAKTYRIRDELINFFSDTPFLVGYTAGEGVRLPGQVSEYFNYSFNLCVAEE